MNLIELTEKNPNFLAMRTWLKNALFSFAIGGIYSILLVFLRLPWAKSKIPFAEFFKTSLVVHVDLTILVWLMSIISLIIVSNASQKAVKYTLFLARAAFAAMLLISIAPLTADGNPLINNYIPILQNKVFLLGLTIFATAVLINAVISLRWQNIFKSPAMQLMLMVLICYFCFFKASLDLKAYFANNEFDPIYYYEMLFWGGGHLMQFIYVHGLLIIWCLIAGRNMKIPFIMNFLFVMFVPLIYLFYDSLDGENLRFFTLHMAFLGGIAPFIAVVILIWKNQSLKKNSIENYYFWTSLFLFALGGLISLSISGSNVKIPAHYHGSTVGVSLAFMGFVVILLPKFLNASEKILQSKLAKFQPMLYCFGQSIHVIGLAISGGYGALRKTPGISGDPAVKFSLGLMGLGGAIAIISGVIFVVICIKAVRRAEQSKSQL